MADFTALKTAIQTYIKQNGNEEITGEKLQEILLSVVTTLGDSAINDLVTALANEVVARQNADGTLQQNITNEATARGNADTALGGRIDDEATTAADQIGAEAEARAAADTALQGLIDGITENIENGYVYAGIATPSSTPATGKVFYLALTAGTYTNFGNTVVSQGINILKYNGSDWSLDAFIAIDDELAPGSNNLPKSGNVLENIIKNGSAFDLSAYNAVDGVLATYADLDAALTALNALPAVYKQGGMSFRFVRTSDNKYMQARLMSDTFSTTVSDWQGVDDEPTPYSDNLVKSGGVAEPINRLNEDVYGGYQYTDKELTLTEDAYYLTGSSIGTTPSPYPDTGVYCASFAVQPGNKIKIFGKGADGGYALRLYAFADSLDNNLGQADLGVDYRSGYEITVPSNAVRMVVNFANYNPSTDKIQELSIVTGLLERVENLEEAEVNVVDNLNSDSSTDALSAKQGKVLADEIYGGHDYLPIEGLELLAGKYYSTQDGYAPFHISITTANHQTTTCCKVPVRPGEKFKIYGKGVNYALYLYAFGDADLLRLEVPEDNIDTRENGLEITAPPTAAWLIVNFDLYNSSTDKLQKWQEIPGSFNQRINVLEDRVDDLEEFKPMLESISLEDKNVVCFGDSLTEMVDSTNSKHYTDYITQMSGANVINVGIGGSQIRRRSVLFKVFNPLQSYAANDVCLYHDEQAETTRIYMFDNAHTGAWNYDDVHLHPYQSLAYSNLDIISLIQASCEQDFEDVIAACEVIKQTQSDDNTDIVNRLVDVDWSKVDAITIFAGTNDWYNANTLGTTDSTDPQKTLGAINEIVRMFLTAYSNIKIYWFTPIVRWVSGFNVNTNPPTIDDTKFSDNYTVEGNGTLKEECAAIIQEVTKNHIPICDMYNNFGWNKYNCKEYFIGTDGTHPRTQKGVVYLANKILNFIYQNKTF